MNFKVDFGAEVTAIFERSYKELKNKPQLEKSWKKTVWTGATPMRVLGQFNTQVSYNGKESIATVFVVS